MIYILFTAYCLIVVATISPTNVHRETTVIFDNGATNIQEPISSQNLQALTWSVFTTNLWCFSRLQLSLSCVFIILIHHLLKLRCSSIRLACRDKMLIWISKGLIIWLL